MGYVATRLAGPANVASGTATVFTGIAAHIYTIRSIRIVNNSAAPITVKLGIGGVTDALLIMPATIIQPGETYTDDAMVVLSGTETLQANASGSGLTITLTGVDSS